MYKFKPLASLLKTCLGDFCFWLFFLLFFLSFSLQIRFSFAFYRSLLLASIILSIVSSKLNFIQPALTDWPDLLLFLKLLCSLKLGTKSFLLAPLSALFSYQFCLILNLKSKKMKEGILIQWTLFKMHLVFWQASTFKLVLEMKEITSFLVLAVSCPGDVIKRYLNADIKLTSNGRARSI